MALIPSAVATAARRSNVWLKQLWMQARRRPGDLFFRGTTYFLVGIVLFAVVGIAWVLVSNSLLTITAFGLSFLSNKAFDPNNGIYGVRPAIFGTLVTSAFALLLAVPLGVGTAIFLVDYCPRALRAPLAFLVDTLAAIPSVVIGLWGLLVMAPWLQQSGGPWLQKYLGFLPFFQGTPRGVGLLAAGLILTLMTLPIITAIAREVMLAVPVAQREALLAVGATRWEVIRHAVLPFARVGIAGGAVLALGRALGETIAVTMVIGNQATKPSPSLFDTGYTLSSVIANQFGEATPGLFRSAVLEAGLILLIITLLTNILARLLISQLGRTRYKRSYPFRRRRGGSVAIASDQRVSARTTGEKTAVFHPLYGASSVRRRFMNAFAGLLTCAFAAAVIIFLLYFVFYIAQQGIRSINVDFFLKEPPLPGSTEGGIVTALEGSSVMLVIASAIGIPFGMATGIYLAEFGRRRIADIVRFLVDVLTGIPTIIFGLFIWVLLVVPTRTFSGLAGGLALSIIMIPTVARATEEIMRLVPGSIRDASIALGGTESRTILRVVLPAARSGIVTGMLLAVARVAGETAPLLMTALGTNFFIYPTRLNIFDQPLDALPLRTFNFTLSPFPVQQHQAFAGACILLTLVIITSFLVRVATNGMARVATNGMQVIIISFVGTLGNRRVQPQRPLDVPAEKGKGASVDVPAEGGEAAYALQGRQR
jgi:phosphate ABC transporter permease protein PstC/phosphate ABC transporter permease subunit PstA